METKKINFTTSYGDGSVSGYVVANVVGNHYEISDRQYKNALKKRVPTGDTNIIFLADRDVLIVNADRTRIEMAATKN